MRKIQVDENTEIGIVFEKAMKKTTIHVATGGFSCCAFMDIDQINDLVAALLCVKAEAERRQ